MTHLLSSVTNFITHIISTLGYPGVALLMAMQTVAVPIPSEVILPFAGFLASTGRFNTLILSGVAAIGSCIGGSIAYYIGLKGGRPLVEKYGRAVLISHRDLEITDRFFGRFGGWAAFFGQLLPVVRSFIAFPAGIARLSYLRFLVFTFVGSFIWSIVLISIGVKLGENWPTLRDKLHGFDNVIVVLIILGIVSWIWRHVKNRAKG